MLLNVAPEGIAEKSMMFLSFIVAPHGLLSVPKLQLRTEVTRQVARRSSLRIVSCLSRPSKSAQTFQDVGSGSQRGPLIARPICFSRPYNDNKAHPKPIILVMSFSSSPAILLSSDRQRHLVPELLVLDAVALIEGFSLSISKSAHLVNLPF